MISAFTSKRSVTRGLLAGVAALAGALLAAPIAVASDCHSRCDSNYYLCNRGTFAKTTYGAIAYSKAAGAHGSSSNEDTERDAAASALADCRANGTGTADCAVLVDFHRGHCGALALGARGAYGSDHAPHRQLAANKALAQCRPYGGDTCRLARVVCTP
jgi:hypothetical protein